MEQEQDTLTLERATKVNKQVLTIPTLDLLPHPTGPLPSPLSPTFSAWYNGGQKTAQLSLLLCCALSVRPPTNCESARPKTKYNLSTTGSEDARTIHPAYMQLIQAFPVTDAFHADETNPSPTALHHPKTPTGHCCCASVDQSAAAKRRAHTHIPTHRWTALFHEGCEHEGSR